MEFNSIEFGHKSRVLEIIEICNIFKIVIWVDFCIDQVYLSHLETIRILLFNISEQCGLFDNFKET